MRAVIADDSVLLREGIARLLAEGGIEVAAGVGDAESLLEAVEIHEPDLAIVDVRMPPTHRDEGLRAAIEIRRRWPDVALLVLSQFVEERYATELLSAQARSVGYLLKDRVADVEEFIEAVQRVAGGGTAIDPEVVRQLLARTHRTDPLGRLTPRERDVLALMAEGALQHVDRRVTRHLDGRGRKARRQHLREARPPGRRRAAPAQSHGRDLLPQRRGLTVSW